MQRGAPPGQPKIQVGRSASKALQIDRPVGTCSSDQWTTCARQEGPNRHAEQHHPFPLSRCAWRVHCNNFFIIDADFGPAKNTGVYMVIAFTLYCKVDRCQASLA